MAVIAVGRPIFITTILCCAVAKKQDRVVPSNYKTM